MFWPVLSSGLPWELSGQVDVSRKFCWYLCLLHGMLLLGQCLSSSALLWREPSRTCSNFSFSSHFCCFSLSRSGESALFVHSGVFGPAVLVSEWPKETELFEFDINIMTSFDTTWLLHYDIIWYNLTTTLWHHLIQPVVHVLVFYTRDTMKIRLSVICMCVCLCVHMFAWRDKPMLHRERNGCHWSIVAKSSGRTPRLNLDTVMQTRLNERTDANSSETF